MDSNLILSSPAPKMPMNHLSKPIYQATFYVKFLLWNARSLNKQIINFQSYIYAADYDIIAITEIWLISTLMKFFQSTTT